jgi:putative membrane protein
MSTTVLNKPLFFDLDQVETLAEEEASITLDYTPPVILPEDTILETNSLDEAYEPALVAPPHLNSSNADAYQISNWPLLVLFVGSLGLLLFLMLVVDSYHFIAQQYDSSLFLGTLFLSLIFTLSAVAITLSWRSYQNIKQLRTVSALQKQGQDLIEQNGYGRAMRYLNQIANFYSQRPDIKARIERFYLNFNDTHHDREMCALFSSQVMKEMDQQAYRIVTQRSKETALMVMISQIALLDTLLTLWRNIRMIRDIASLYGGRPGFFGSIVLIGSVLQNLIYADVSEAVADSVGEILGGSVLSVMSAQAAQGLGSGVLTARLGLHAMTACRPLPFLEGEKPRLKDIRKEIVSKLSGVFETKNTLKKTA